MLEDSKYQRLALKFDHALQRQGFRRICDYSRRIREDDLNVLEEAIETAKNERPLQHLFQERPHLLINAESAHGCRWIKPTPRLGSDYVPDFAIARLDSGGLSWTLIELQSPDTNFFIDNAKPGRAKPGEQLREGLDQISRWRGWISKRGSATVESDGYPGLTSEFRGVVYIGRRGGKLQDHDDDQRINELGRQQGVIISSYDSIYWAAWDELNPCFIDHPLD